MIKVKQYTRKDGILVHSHDRSKPEFGLNFTKEELEQIDFKKHIISNSKADETFSSLVNDALKTNEARKSKKEDNKRDNKKVLKMTEKGVSRWKKNPGRHDLAGIDTKNHVTKKELLEIFKKEKKKIEELVDVKKSKETQKTLLKTELKIKSEEIKTKPELKAQIKEVKSTVDRLIQQDQKILKGRRKEFQDIGEKFGGAKKDYYAQLRKLNWEDVQELEKNQADALQFITKDKIIPPINEQAEIEAGVSVGTIFLKKLTRKYLLNKPKVNSKEARAFYYQEANNVFEDLQVIKTVDEFLKYQREYGRQLWTRRLSKEYYKDRMGIKFYAILTRTTRGAALKTSEAKQLDIRNASMEEADKLLEDQKKTGGIRSKTYKKPYLEYVSRKGGKEVPTADAEKIIKELGLRGVEYGNWVNDEEAKKNVKFFIASMYDLQDATGIDVIDMNKEKKLGIAFGSRGSGSALAHFEPFRNVINLTKKNGDGSLAHEWGHYMDHMLKSKFGDSEDNVGGAAIHLTEETGKTSNEVQRAMQELMNSLIKGDGVQIQTFEESKRYKPHPRMISRVKNALAEGKNLQSLYNEKEADVKQRTDRWKEYLKRNYPTQYEKRADKEDKKNARELKQYGELLAYFEKDKKLELKIQTGKTEYYNRSQAQGKSGDYWTRKHELFARAFESYVQDQLSDSNRRNSYLANGTTIETSGGASKAKFPYPMGAERNKINGAFDKFLGVVKRNWKQGEATPIKESKIEKKRKPAKGSFSSSIQKTIDKMNEQAETARAEIQAEAQKQKNYSTEIEYSEFLKKWTYKVRDSTNQIVVSGFAKNKKEAEDEVKQYI